MDFVSLRLAKLTSFLHLVDLCLDLGVGENKHPNGKFGSAFPFLSYRP